MSLGHAAAVHLITTRPAAAAGCQDDMPRLAVMLMAAFYAVVSYTRAALAPPQSRSRRRCQLPPSAASAAIS